ncbi:hypothetical protein BCR41DRAFT_401184 [Lobosporangium transversale]|uniref:F-box domain-containing protein n=1 Tax=Lobosporangium transversale TaxID=64571 RepID=A0A1Y2GCT3_9FUNG|nr:hypothetical protein BCR41DRAFT_401184 [Lobosporangium transversale]ORZ04327.1 hypothetical protein BCR41DRAFT_401184 [Lobosporangium transversale]|eukprot:XP_021876485.1 hypothetical protein BCR41DRAFT_401184 [Lobosporangium transversale]
MPSLLASALSPPPDIMNDIKLHPLDLPEIISHIGRFLSRKDLLNCIRISSTFYNTLISSIWGKIRVDSEQHPERLTWPTGEAFAVTQGDQEVCDEFYRTVFLQHPWTLTSLSVLAFAFMSIKDEDMAALLRRMTKVKRLDVSSCDFGPLSMRELLSSEQETDGIVQAVLTNCPSLKELIGPKVTVPEIINGAEWVCTKLTDLTVFLENDIDQETAESMEQQRIVFRKLGKLTDLEELYLTGYCKNRGEMQPEDAAWLLKNWPRIEYLEGLVNIEPSVCKSIDEILSPRVWLNY